MNIDTGDTAWMLVSTSLVMLAVMGVALFHGGMARRKNALATIMYGFTALCVGSLLWVVWGYSLAFGPDRGGIIGGLDWLGLAGMPEKAAPAWAGIPRLLHMMFHGMLAALAPALIGGSLAERMKFSAFLVFSVLWLTFVYVPLAHSVWGGGWIGSFLGALDFAGGFAAVVAAGVASLVAARMVGPRRGYGTEPFPPHSRPLAVLGAALLWFGWLGVTAGSAFSAGGVAAHAATATILAGGAAGLGWAALERLHRGKATTVGAVMGSIAGLAAITPGAGFVSVVSAVPIGAFAAVLSYAAVQLMPRLNTDDALDVFGTFGVGGAWGVLATGVFASAAVNPAAIDGVLAGNPPLLGIQAIALIAVMAYSAVYTWVILKIVNWTVGLRVVTEEETEGLDQTQHGERGYAL